MARIWETAKLLYAVERGRPRESDVTKRSSPSPLTAQHPGDSVVLYNSHPLAVSCPNRLKGPTAMVSMGKSGCPSVHKRSWTDRARAPTPGQQRHRKQTLTARLSDSGFEEDLGSSPGPARADGPEAPAAGHLSGTWCLQYGHIGFSIERQKEAHFHPCKSLERQPQLTADARCRLVSWLIPVHKYFHLSFECCCLAVNIMDRFLTSTPVAADCFQLLGVTALLLASKQVEVCSPRISQLLSLCCDAFTKEQLCNLECLILLRLNFCLAAPTLAFFLDYYTNCIERKNPDIKRSKDRSFLAQKMCELSLADYAFNKYPPSLTASCALTLANELLKTTQGSVPQASIQSQGEQWDAFMDELYESNTSTADSVPSQIPDIAHCRPDYSLAQECKNNLKLLASLNQEALEIM
ncbi:cyclin-O [Sphaeramia orbicularis]|uniref:cyclin-O n=1 Tax=Sphaeramia orbicularis TaxID=375764 RepID=UPI00117D771A|nr:cyclin-O [Sphaeramia orbicularis]